MTTTFRTALSIAAFAGASLAMSAHAVDLGPGEAWGSQMTQMQTQQGSALSRAEVQADMALWQDAGLQAVNAGEAPTLSSDTYQERLADYQQMRSGPQYVAEVRSLGGNVDMAAWQPAVLYVH